MIFVDLLLAIIKVSVNEKSRVYRKKLQIANSNLFSPHCVMLDFPMVPQLVSIACMVTTKYKNAASYSWHIMLFYWHGNSISVWKFN